MSCVPWIQTDHDLFLLFSFSGQKIEVKIITAGYFDTNKEGVHVLSEEESSAFNNMIVSILVSDTFFVFLFYYYKYKFCSSLGN